MRFPQAKPEKNNGRSLTLPVKTRSPLEAFVMLRTGQSVDRALGYYQDQTGAEKDLYMMDKLEKLHSISRLKEMYESSKNEIDSVIEQYNANQTPINNGQTSPAAT